MITADIWHICVASFVFLFGAAIGSFLNVVIIRMPEDKSIVSPPSHCPNCDYQIRWYDNIPILSYIILGGKCRGCKLPISIQYPLIELLTAALAVAIFMKFGLSVSLIVYFIFAALLIAITFIDLPYQIIPNELSIGGVVVGFAASFIPGQIGWFDSLMGLVIGFSLIALIAYGYYFLTGREGMGMGDAKLLAMIGAFLGWQSIPFLLLAASVQGIILALFAIGFGFMKKAGPKDDPRDIREAIAANAETGQKEQAEQAEQAEEEVPLRLAAVPFGPFLSIAAIEFLFFGSYYYKFLTGMYQ